MIRALSPPPSPLCTVHTGLARLTSVVDYLCTTHYYDHAHSVYQTMLTGNDTQATNHDHYSVYNYQVSPGLSNKPG